MVINESITDPDKFKYVHGKFPVEYLYTVGNGLEPFFKNLKEKGKFIGSKCVKCNITYVPPTTFCERCFSRLEKTIPIGNTGILESYTTTFIDVDGNRLKKPIVWGLIKLDGASTAIVHMLLVNPDKAKIGMKVVARFKPANKRTGSISDVDGFVPVK